MASTYTTNLGIEKIGTGEQSGTWGETTNLNFDILDQAINGLVSVTLPAVGSTGSPNTLPITDGALSDGRNAFIELVDGGDLGGTAYVQLTPNDSEKIAYVRNSLSGGQSVILFQGTYNASNDFELANGKDALLYFNGGGTGAVVAVVQANEVRSGSFQIDNIVLDGNTIDVDGDLTIDVSDSDVLLKDDGTTFGGFSLGGTGTDNLVIKSGSTPTAALTLHEGNVGFGTQDEASYLIDAQSASAGIQARFISTEAGATSGPDLKFYRNSASPADSDIISTFYFNANTDDGAGGVSLSDVNYGSIVFNAVETNETLGEAAGFALNLKRGGTTQQYISIVGGTTSDTDDDSITLSTGGTAAITIDNSQNVTFDTDTLYVDATNNRVGVGTDSPSNLLHVLSSGTTTETVAKFGTTTYGNLGTTYIELGTQFGDGGSRIGSFNGPSGNYGTLLFETMSNSSGVFDERLRLDSAAAVFNEASENFDFRVESNNNTHALFVDAGNDRIGMFTSSTADNYRVTIDTTDTLGTRITSSATASAARLYLESSGGQLYSLTNFGSGATLANDFEIEDATNATSILHYVDNSETVFNEDSKDIDFRVESDASTHMLFVDAGNNRVGINKSDPSYTLHVSSSSTDIMQLTSTDGTANSGPNLSLFRDSSTPADSDVQGTIFFVGKDDGGGTNTYAYIESRAGDVSNGAEKGQLRFFVDSNNSLANYFELDGNNAEVCVNEESRDVDFRIESDNSSNMFRVDAANDRIGIAGLPDSLFHVYTKNSTDSGLRIEPTVAGSSSVRIAIDSNTQDDLFNLDVSEASGNGITTIAGKIDGTLKEMIRLGSTGGLIFNEGSNNNIDFRVESDSNANMLKVDAADNRVGIGTSSPTETLTVQSHTDAGVLVTRSNSTPSTNGSVLTLDALIDVGTQGNIAEFHPHLGSSIQAYLKISATRDNTATSRRVIIDAIDSADDGSALLCLNSVNDGGAAVVMGDTSASFPTNVRAFKVFEASIAVSHNTSNSSGDSYVRFGYSTNTIGSITQSGTTGVAYNTSSDYRLKENIVDMTGAIDRVKKLNPSRFNFIADPDTTVDGFLAHEAATVVPEAVTGTHNEVEAIGTITDAEGGVIESGVTEPLELQEGQVWTKTSDRPVYQGIDQSKLVPLLTGALQEAIAKIESLEARVATLEAN